MKVSSVFFVTCLAPAASFSPPARAFIKRTSLGMALDLTGNDWKPEDDIPKMGSTDTPDYFPDDYDPDINFADGIMGSQSGSGNKSGPELPGMENLGEDAVVVGGIEFATDIPEGMVFKVSSIPDGTVEMNCGANGKGVDFALEVKPVCMGYEDFYAAFAPGSHESFSVSPSAGRMERRGGEPSLLVITCQPRGASGVLEGDLVINLPEDESSICYKVSCTAL